MTPDKTSEFRVNRDDLRDWTLVIIDMQHAFQKESSQWCVPRFGEAQAVIQRLIATLSCRVVHTRFVPDPEESGTWRSYYDHWSEMRLPPSDAIWNSTLDLGEADLVVDAGTFGKWPQLASHIPLGSTLVMTGVATDCCVLSTALGAIDAGRRVVLVSDACAAVDDDAQAKSLDLLRLLVPLCEVVDSRQLLNAVGA